MLRRASFAVVAAVLAVGLAHPSHARADGDPCSDELLFQQVCYPSNPPSDAAKAKLTALVAAANKAGVPIRVGIIQNKIDLGSDPSWWNNPQGIGSNPPNTGYSGFLDEEIVAEWKHGLLVVMPAGYGYRNGGKLKISTKNGISSISEKLNPVTQQWAVLSKLPKPKSGSSDDLVAAAETAVRALAKQAGHTLPANPPPVPGGGTSGPGGPPPPVSHAATPSSSSGSSFPLTGIFVVVALLLVGFLVAIPFIRRRHMAEVEDDDEVTGEQ
jgi:hypothetical protein